MVVLLSTTVISCSQAFGIIDRLRDVVGLSSQQKMEIILELKKLIPSCPIKIVESKK